MISTAKQIVAEQIAALNTVHESLPKGWDFHYFIMPEIRQYTLWPLEVLHEIHMCLKDTTSASDALAEIDELLDEYQEFARRSPEEVEYKIKISTCYRIRKCIAKLDLDDRGIDY